MVLVLCVIMDIHPGARTAGLMELRPGGDTAQCSGPFPFPLTFRRGGGGGGGGATPMRRLLSPGVSERCSSAASGQRGARRPLCGQWARLEKHTHAHTQARSPSMHPSTPWRSSGHFQRNFDTSNYGGLGSDRSIPGPNRRTEERRTDNRLRSRQRLGPSLSASTGVSPPRGAFQDKRFCLSLHVYTSLLPPLIPHRRRLISELRRSAEEGEKTASGQA